MADWSDSAWGAGFFDFDAATGKLSGSLGQQRVLVERQIDAAEEGMRWTGGAHPNFAWTSPTEDVEAYYRVGYWLAVAARKLIGQGRRTEANRLIDAAREAVSSGYRRSLVPGWGTDSPAVMRQIMLEGASLAQAAGATQEATALGLSSTEEGMRRQTQIDAPTKVSPGLAIQAQEFAQDAEDVGGSIARFTSTIKGLATGEKPSHLDDGQWFLRKWGGRIVVGGLIVAALAVFLRPYAAMGSAMLPRRRRNPRKGQVPPWMLYGAAALGAVIWLRRARSGFQP